MCDICMRSEEISEVTADEMRRAVEKGFDPFATRLVNESTVDQWSKGLYGKIYGRAGDKDFTPAYKEALNNWKSELVATETSAWRFCSDCDSKLSPYTFALSKPRHTAEEVAAENNISAMMFGDLEPERGGGGEISLGVVGAFVIILLLIAFGIYWFWIR